MDINVNGIADTASDYERQTLVEGAIFALFCWVGGRIYRSLPPRGQRAVQNSFLLLGMWLGVKAVWDDTQWNPNSTDPRMSPPDPGYTHVMVIVAIVCFAVFVLRLARGPRAHAASQDTPAA